MKIPTLALLLTCTAVWAQDNATPAATPQPPAQALGSTNQPLPFRLPGVPNPPTGATGAANRAAAPGAFPVPSFPRPLRPVPGTANTAAAPAVQPAPGQLPPGTVRPGEQVVAIPPSVSAGTNAPQEEMIPAGMIKFPATDLNQVLKVYAELVGRTVLRPTTLPAPTITLETQTPLTKTEAIAAFKAVLGLNGIAVIDVGDKFVKVVPAAQAGQVGGVFNKAPADQLPELGQFVTHVVQTTYVKPSEIQQALTPFASPGLANGILPIDSSQMLILRDYTENVKRMLEMVKKIDVPVPSEYISEVIPIKYALASEIANALNSLSSGGGGTTVGGGTGTPGAANAQGGRSFGSSFGRGGGYGSYGSSYGRSSYGSSYGGGYGGYGGMGTVPYAAVTPVAGTPPNSTFTDRLRNIIQKVQKEGEIQVLGQTKIIADERTNSLLIFAGRDDMKTIKDIVAKLDVVLAQVLIEAVIVEVSLNNSRSLGISYLQKQPQPGGSSYFQGIGAINNNNLLNAGSFNSIISNTNSAFNLPQGFSYLANLGGDLDVTLTALAGDSRARILQRPRIQTSHAVPAQLFVGESRPYPTGSYYGGGAYGSYSSIQQLPIGVSLEVTPLINPDGLVVMDIHQHIESFKGNVTIQGVGDVPITSQKDASAKVAVRDHDTIMLGGLIENSRNSNNSGVPFLKDIPLLGALFRSSSQDSTRSELIVLIRPTVLPTPEVAALTAKAEQNKMPEIKRVEKEVEEFDAKRLKESERLDHKK